jgi:acetyl esterase/lipase
LVAVVVHVLPPSELLWTVHAASRCAASRVQDCLLSWFAAHAAELGVDPERIAIHGGSAGGGLCAALALLARDRGGPSIAFQYLGIPELDDRLGTLSMTTFIDTPSWNRPAAIRSWDAYLGEGRRGNDDVSPYAAPARATDFSGLPPAYISAMEFDPLRDEDIAYRCSPGASRSNSTCSPARSTAHP